jgi:ribosome-associated translation inhibitor RaiA
MQIEVRALNVRIDDSHRDFIERRLLFALGRFGGRIRRVLVRLEDVNGPRGGLDKRCHIDARLAGRGTLVVEVRDVELEPAISRAAERIGRRVRDELAARGSQRQRGATSTGPAPAA